MQGHPLLSHDTESVLPKNRSGRHAALMIAMVAVVYCLALAPFAFNYLAYHPDERHYTDGAILMVDSGDYLTPRDPDGTPRFLKPAVCYWLIAASYQAFGISPFSSRLPFLLLGGGVIALSAVVASRVTGRRAVALLTAFILATNPLLVMASLCSLTDIVQTFCLLLSLYGWIGLLQDKPDRHVWWWICLGAGLAVATKGVPGILLTLYGFCFLRFNPWRRISMPRNAWLLPACCGMLIAASWYVAMFVMHGPEAWACFFEDQVQSRVPMKWWHPLRQIPLVLCVYLALLFPWSVPVMRAFRTQIQPRLSLLSATQKLLLAFLAGWPVLLFVPLSVISPFTPRYFLLSAPMLAILCAWGWDCLPESQHLRNLHVWRTRILWCATVVAIGAALILLVPEAHHVRTIYVCTLFLLAVGALVLRYFVPTPFTRRCAGLAGSFLILFPLVFTVAAPLGLPDQAETIATRLEEVIPPDRHPEIWFVGKPALAAKMRIYLHNSHPFHAAEALTMEHLPVGSATWIICRQEDAEQGLDPEHYRWQAVSHGYKDLRAGEFCVALWRGALSDYLATRQQIFVIAQPRTAEEGISTAGE